MGSRLYQLECAVDTIPHFWGHDPDEFAPKAGGELLERVWEDPAACLKAWGISETDFKAKGVQPPFLEQEPFFTSQYVKDRWHAGDITVMAKVGPDGKLIALRPCPGGYALYPFAEYILKESERCTYRAGTVGGKPMTGVCLFEIKFRNGHYRGN
jgi:hypothetical protein